MPELILQATKGDTPIWATAATVHALFGVGLRALKTLVDKGHVKAKKMPGGQQSGRLYKVLGERSLSEYLERGDEAKETQECGN